MFVEPQRIPYQVVNDDSQAHDRTQDIDCEKYGSDYIPRSSVRVTEVPEDKPES